MTTMIDKNVCAGCVYYYKEYGYENCEIYGQPDEPETGAPKCPCYRPVKDSYPETDDDFDDLFR